MLCPQPQRTAWSASPRVPLRAQRPVSVTSQGPSGRRGSQPQCRGIHMRDQAIPTGSDTEHQACATRPIGRLRPGARSKFTRSPRRLPRLLSPAALRLDTGQTLEVDFSLLCIIQGRLTSCNSLRAVDVPHHRQRTRIPAIHPPDNTTLIRPDQIGDRDAFDLIFVHCLLNSCIVALRIAAWDSQAFAATACRASLISVNWSSLR